jgi:GNAT superfamily N-acetyltransferase
MRTVTKHVGDLTAVEYRACWDANYRSGGYMQGTLGEIRRGERDGFVIMLWDGPRTNQGNMAAWCLVTPVSLTGISQGTRYSMKKAKYTVEFWVKRRYRKQGLATRLMKEVKKYDDTPHVFPHSKASGEFFSKFNVTASGGDRRWLKNKPKVA